jgi:hypothetical protein
MFDINVKGWDFELGAVGVVVYAPSAPSAKTQQWTDAAVQEELSGGVEIGQSSQDMRLLNR